MDAVIFSKCVLQLDYKSNSLLLKSSTDFETVFNRLKCLNSKDEQINLAEITSIKKHPFSPHLALISKKAIWISVNLENIINNVPKLVVLTISDQYPKNGSVKFKKLRLQSLHVKLRLNLVEWLNDDQLSLTILYNGNYLGIFDANTDKLKCFVDTAIILQKPLRTSSREIGHSHKYKSTTHHEHNEVAHVLDVTVMNVDYSNKQVLTQTCLFFVLCNNGIIITFVYSKDRFSDKCCLNYLGSAKIYGKNTNMLAFAYKIFSINPSCLPQMIGLLTTDFNLCTFIVNIKQDIIQSSNDNTCVKLYPVEIVNLKPWIIIKELDKDEKSVVEKKKSENSDKSLFNNSSGLTNYNECSLSLRFGQLSASINHENNTLELVSNDFEVGNPNQNDIHSKLKSFENNQIPSLSQNSSENDQATTTNNTNTQIDDDDNRIDIKKPTCDYDPGKLKKLSQLLKDCKLNTANISTNNLPTVHIKINESNNSDAIIIYTESIVLEIKLHYMDMLSYSYINNLPLSMDSLVNSEVIELFSIDKYENKSNRDIIRGLVFTTNANVPICVFFNNNNYVKLHLNVTDKQISNFYNKLYYNNNNNNSAPKTIYDTCKLYNEAITILECLKPKSDLKDMYVDNTNNLTQLPVLLEILRSYSVYMNQYVFVRSHLEELYLVFVKNMQNEISQFKPKLVSLIEKLSKGSVDTDRSTKLKDIDAKIIQISNLSQLSQNAPFPLYNHNSENVKFYKDKIARIKHYLTYIDNMKKKIWDLKKQMILAQNTSGKMDSTEQAIALNNRLCLENYKKELSEIRDHFKKEQLYVNIIMDKTSKLATQMKYLHNELG